MSDTTESESETEDGEVKDRSKISSRTRTSTPVDLAKSVEKVKREACELARKKLDLSPTSSPAKDKVRTGTALNNPDPVLMPALAPGLAQEVCTVLKNPDPELVSRSVPELEPDLEHEVQAASNREAAGTEAKVERPRRNCAINSYYSNNYVLGTEIAKTKSMCRSRSLSMTSNRRSEKGSNPTKKPSILPFLKPTGAPTKMGQNETLPKPKVTTKSFDDLKNLEVKVSQTLMKDFFSKN